MEKTALESVSFYPFESENARTCGCIMTFNGAVVGCTPITAGARGRAKCKKESVVTAMLGSIWLRDQADVRCQRLRPLLDLDVPLSYTRLLA